MAIDLDDVCRFGFILIHMPCVLSHLVSDGWDSDPSGLGGFCAIAWVVKSHPATFLVNVSHNLLKFPLLPPAEALPKPQPLCCRNFVIKAHIITSAELGYRLVLAFCCPLKPKWPLFNRMKRPGRVLVGAAPEVPGRSSMITLLFKAWILFRSPASMFCECPSEDKTCKPHQGTLASPNSSELRGSNALVIPTHSLATDGNRIIFLIFTGLTSYLMVINTAETFGRPPHGHGPPLPVVWWYGGCQSLMLYKGCTNRYKTYLSVCRSKKGFNEKIRSKKGLETKLTWLQ